MFMHAFSSKMAVSSLLIQTLILCNLFLISKSIDFSFINGFNDKDLDLYENASLTKTSSGAIELTNTSPNEIGRAFYPTPIPMLNSSFTTHFIFQINPSRSNDGGFGLAFVLSESRQFPGAAAGHYLGVFNNQSSAVNPSSHHVFMVEFDTVKGIDEGTDSDGNHVGINLNGMNSNFVQSAEINLQKSQPIKVWIDYDGIKKQVNVTIARLNVETKPSKPLISEIINDMSDVLKGNMYAGFSAATGPDKWSFHYILGWSFSLNGTAKELDTSLLPAVPNEKSSSLNSRLKTALIATLSAVLLVSLATLIVIFFYRRSMMFEVLEDWELDCPHRFRYRDLHKATKGFKDTEKIGVGGFGAVYKGVLPSTGAEVAVKKIKSDNPLQGMREFAAEIESLGRLRHKNLVHLQGWCKYKNNLVLVYDYVPNGSLDSLLYNSNSGVELSWEKRFNIIKGIASGLLYLHEEWEQVVIHRDVKSSNVLIDRDLSPRLGDFGLARLYDHGQNSHTTKVVGTIGYIAPELIRTGKASKRSDVFAYGILLLEIACGRGAVVHEAHRNVILVDWVAECMQMGNIFYAVDATLNSVYVVQEMELVLGLGLLCSHPRPESRPTMRQVMKYLNGDEVLPLVEKLSSDGPTRSDEITSRFMALGLFDRMGNSETSYHFSSIGAMSSSSFDSGR